jgi:hypothetical protein
MLGRFLELSLPAPRILESWQYYQALGFVSAVVGEIWPHRYAVVTDGRIALGLHDAELAGPTLSYVLPELARELTALESGGVEFESRTLGNYDFNEARFTAPGGQHARLLEARTFSPPEHPPSSVLGWFEEYALPVDDLGRARDFWEGLGFVTVAEQEEPWPHLSLTSDTLNLGLYPRRELATPTLVFSCDELAPLRERLAALGIESRGRLPRSLDPATHLVLEGPEGLTLLVTPPPG